MLDPLNRRETSRIPVYKQGRLQFPFERDGVVVAVTLPVMVREVAPGGVSFVLCEGDMPRPGLAVITRHLDVDRGDVFQLALDLGADRVTLEGVVRWCQISGGGVLPVRWTIGIDIASASQQTRQHLGNWVFLAKEALHEALCHAQRGDWEEARLLIDDLGLNDLPTDVLHGVLDEYIARADKTPMATPYDRAVVREPSHA